MKKNQQNVTGGAVTKSGFRKTLGSIGSNWELYVMIIPAILFYAIFCYWPMYGALIAFQNYKPFLGMSGSEWVGFDNFMQFLSSPYFFEKMENTLTISVSTLFFSFPTPIILALLINEVRSKIFAKTVQTITYMPHFISLVIVCSMVRMFVAEDGFINQFFQIFGYDGESMLSKPGLFVPIYVISGVWQEIGWNSIIYLAALSSVDQELYEAAKIDGAGRIAQTWHVTLPGILPTIIILLIMKMGSMLSVGYEKILLLYNAGIYETADVISTYTYRIGLVDRNFGLSTAVGLFNSAINIILIITTNKISDKLSGTSLF